MVFEYLLSYNNLDLDLKTDPGVYPGVYPGVPWALENNYGFRRPCKACQSETRDQKLKLNEDDVHITLFFLQSKSIYICKSSRRELLI